MRKLIWEDRYSVGNEVVDSQHKRLFEMYNRFVEEVTKGSSKSIIGDLMEQLIEYVAFHFSDEERLMKEGGYPELEAHRKVHKELREKVYAIFTNYINGEPVDLQEVAGFLEEWIKNHVLVMDMKYKDHIKGLV